MNKRALLVISLVVSLALTSGCVKRNLHIGSSPPGATVFMNGDKLGTTPLDFDFMHYAVHEVELRKEGYETLISLENLKPPLHLWPPFEFFCEIIPRDFWDRKELYYTLTPLPQQTE